jgi:DNA-binding PadR family transcriptional regulator
MSALTPDETLLGLLMLQMRHGYDLLACFRDPAQLGAVWALSTSQIYAVLKRLETQGDILGSKTEQANAPPRITYHLTQQGEARLQQWLDEPHPSASVRRVRVEFLSRIYIARLLNIPSVPIAQRQKRACRVELARLRAERDQAASGMAYLTHEFVIGQLEAILRWIDRVELMPQDEE